MPKKNEFKIGDQVFVHGYDSTGHFNYGFRGIVVEVNDLSVKAKLELGYHTRVWFGQCEKDETEEGK